MNEAAEREESGVTENDPMVLAAGRVLDSALAAIRQCLATSPAEA